MTNIFAVCSGIVATAASSVGGLTGTTATLPTEISQAITEVGFLASIPLWLVTLLGSLFITGLAFIMILTVYGRFFKMHELLEQETMLQELVGDTVWLTEDAQAVLKRLPEDLSPERRAIIETACSLVGKVNYFWGGHPWSWRRSGQSA